MSEKMVQRRQELVQRLERGLQMAQESDRFRQYLTTCAKFHRYSFQNTMLIWLQRPSATHVAGFHAWLAKFNRHVKRGEKGIQILAPGTTRKRREDREPSEDDEDERAAVETATYFFPVHVFDISQTEGDPLPTVTDELQGADGAGLLDKLERLAQREGLTVDRTDGRGNGTNGFYGHEHKEIWLRPAMSPTMTARTLCHELAHHVTYDATPIREERETIAESVAYVVLGHFDIEADDYSFGYLASWADVKVFREKVGTIHTAAAQIIDSIENGA